MKHRIKVYSIHWPEFHGVGARLWYVACTNRTTCAWEPQYPTEWPDGVYRYARPTWDAALALGVAHLREKACIHV